MRRLGELPGVVQVGFGLKEARGEVLPVWAYRVYVRRKRPRDELSSEEIIPAEIDGIKTDVHVYTHVQHHTKTPSIAPGDEIQRWLPNNPQDAGTLGLIVRKGGARHILTCHHVLIDSSLLLSGNADVYDPHRKSCAGIQCNNPVAAIIPNQGMRQNYTYAADSKIYWVDATIATVNAGIDSNNAIPGIGALDQGIRDLSTEPLSGSAPTSIVTVQKVGRSTGFTQGVVVQLFSVISGDTVWDIRIKPSPGYAYSANFELAAGVDPTLIIDVYNSDTNLGVTATLDTSSGKNVIRLSGHVFSLPGDSGAIVVDNQRKIVGLLHAGSVVPDVNVMQDGSIQTVPLETGNTYAAFINPCLVAMGMDLATAVVQPGSPSAGAVVEGELPLAARERDWHATPQRILGEVERLAERSQTGRRMLGLVQQHYPQIARLVHHRRRVKVTWHRNRGPAFANRLLHALGEQQGTFPEEIGDVHLCDALERFRAVLMIEGDDALRASLERDGDLIVDLARKARSLPELLKLIEGEP
ncbi:hypothetical protein [Dyella sp. GSA-30]|uniref:hypothetical protein n=1 Tax=Dyella sp. GSA-30 TaxID=2994496 RepID=UPI00248F8053|nr:hypothetical protein [Dyella sp. GSA-30]